MPHGKLGCTYHRDKENPILKNDSPNPRIWQKTKTGPCKQCVEQRGTFKKSPNYAYLYQKIIVLPKHAKKSADEEMKKWYWNHTLVPIGDMREGIFELGLKITLKNVH